MAVGKDKTRILLTLPQDLKDELSDEAKDDNRSLNNYILNLLLSSEKRSENSSDWRKIQSFRGFPDSGFFIFANNRKVESNIQNNLVAILRNPLRVIMRFTTWIE